MLAVQEPGNSPAVTRHTALSGCGTIAETGHTHPAEDAASFPPGPGVIASNNPGIRGLRGKRYNRARKGPVIPGFPGGHTPKNLPGWFRRNAAGAERFRSPSPGAFSPLISRLFHSFSWKTRIRSMSASGALQKIPAMSTSVSRPLHAKRKHAAGTGRNSRTA
jgi:hypothetical protein